MTNPSKRKGTTYESTVVTHLRKQGFSYAERRALHGNVDQGDVAGIPGLMLELKACKALELAAWMDEVRVQKRNAGATVGACVVKRRNQPVGRSYVVMELDEWLELVR